jgi:hypothetical protein
VANGDFPSFFEARLRAYLRLQTSAPPPPDTAAGVQRAIAAAARDYASTRQSPPPLAVPTRDGNKVPAAVRDVLERKGQILGAVVADRMPLADGETLTNSYWTVLLAPWQGFDAGTLAYLQQTNLATVAHVLPYVNVQLSTGAIRLLAGQYVITTKDPSGPQAQPLDVRPQGMAAAVDPGQALLTFATVAAFALPQPWGVLVAGALSVVQMFFGGSRDQSAVFVAALQALLQSIEAYYVVSQIKDAATRVQDATDWLNKQTTIIQDLGNDASARTYIMETGLRQVSDVDQENSPLRNALVTLLNVDLPGDPSAWDLRMKAFDVLVMGVSVYLTYLRVRVQMQAALESAPDYQGPQQVYAFYDSFRIDASHWATTLSQRINDLHTQRRGLIGPVQRGMDHRFCWGQLDCSLAAATDGYWTFADYEPGKGTQGRWQDTGVFHSSCTGAYYSSVQHKDQADAARANYVASVDAQLTQHFAAASQAIQGWTASISAWNESMVPRTPQTAPRVGDDTSRWAARTPQGPHWVRGAKVRYAVAFGNDAGNSPLGPWSDWVPIADQAWPKVTGLPIDALGLATARQLSRQFMDPQGVVQPPGVVTILQDNQTTTYQDSNN